MAKDAEGAMVTFMDKHGHERTDVAMLDPSAFLCGCGPISRYLKSQAPATTWLPCGIHFVLPV